MTTPAVLLDRERDAIQRMQSIVGAAQVVLHGLHESSDAALVTPARVEEALIEVATLASEASSLATRWSKRVANRRRAAVARATAESCRKSDA